MSQVKNGKAFEYSLALKISKQVKQNIVTNKALNTAKAYYEAYSNKEYLNKAASEASVFLQCHDKRFDDARLIMIQDDLKGRHGDVRDIIVILTPNGEIGISAKHNHKAVKHSRLSDKIDFGKEWCDCPVSNHYWNRISPIFDDLRKKGRQDQLFKNITNKDSTVYLPVLSAFQDELKRLCEDCGQRFIKRLFQYIVGKNDFYKVICEKRVVSVSSMNIEGTLKWGKKWHIPSKIEMIARRQGSINTLLVSFEGGWQLSFRIHNASSKVEPSLKFDIQFVGMPQSVNRHEIPLNSDAQLYI